MFKCIRAVRRAFLSVLITLLPLASQAGFFISNGQLADANGAPFMMRGVNYPYSWYASRGDVAVQQDFANIAATGANTVRVVLTTGGQWPRVAGAQVTQIIQWCKALKMVAVLEVHDSTGWGEQSTAVPISNAVAYWTSADIRAAINGQENFVIINIANEPFGNNTTANYLPDTIAAIQSLRNAGLTHTLMVDAANWGQDWSGTMRDNALQLWNADSLRNLVFSVHMYEVYQSLATVTAYMQAFDDKNLPLVIGEFGPVNNGAFVDSESVIAQATARANGYLAWSWSGNGGGGAGLDMTVNFDPAQLTTWGNRIINGANGIRATSVLATVFGSSNSLSVSPTSLSLGAGASSAAVTVTANVSWTVTDNQTWLTVTPAAGANNGSFTVSATANTGTAARTGTVTVTGGGLTRTIAVTQAAPATSSLTLSATSLALASGAASSSVTLTSNVSWTVTVNQAWLTVTPASGANNGTLTVSATANTGTASRSGTVTVTGGGLTRTLAVTQAAPSASTLTLSTAALTLAATAASSTVTVTANVSWTVGDDQTWITVAPTSGSNNGTFTVSATANTGSVSRSGIVTVTGGGLSRTIAVSQAAAGGSVGACPNPVTFSGNTGNFNTTGAVCYRTNATVNGWGCFNFDGRTVTVGGVVRTCGQLPLTRSSDGYYYFSVSAGLYPWAGLYTF